MVSKGAKDKTTLYCSFCGKSQHEVKKLIAGPTVFICSDCVGICTDIIGGEHSHLSKLFQGDKADVKEIRTALASVMSVPSHAITVLARLLYKRAIYLAGKASGLDPRTRPPLVLLRGPSLGRAECMLKLSGLRIGPLLAVDAIQASENGAPHEIGQDILRELLNKVNYDFSVAEAGFVYIDDLDSVYRPPGSDENTTPAGANLQASLVAISSRAETNLRESENRGAEQFIDMRGVMFILGGAFRCLKDVAKAPLVPPSTEIAKASDDQTPPGLTEAQAKALIDYGFDARLVERIETIIDLNDV